MYSVSDETRKPIFEGVQGENEAREIQFDVTAWVEELGEGVCTATAKRPTDTTPYPVTVTRSGNVVTWKPNSTDTSIEGIGAFQLAFSINDVVAKTRIWNTKIAPSLVGAGDPPDPYDDWIQDLRDIAAETLTYSQNAENSADDAEAEKLESEAWAKGTKNGTPVSSSDAQYQNNAKYYSEESYKNAEAWAVGQRGGVDVPSTDPTYENNSKYWAEQSLANQYGAFIVKSASGDIASFADGADNVPMKSLNVTITPKQSGSGDPSPSNVRPITGWTDADVNVARTNALANSFNDTSNGAEVSKYLDSNGNLVNQVGYAVTEYIPVEEGDDCSLSIGGVNAPSLCFYDKNKTFLIGKKYNNRSPITEIAPANAKFVRFSYGPSWGTIVTVHTTTTPVPLGQTVYGGTVDVVSGELKIIPTSVFNMKGRTWSKSGNTFYTQLNDVVRPATRTNNIMCNAFKSAPNNTWFSDIADLSCCSYNQSPESYMGQNWIYFRDDSCGTSAEFKTKVDALSEFYIVAPTSATPATVQLTPTQVASLLGTNNVWADCGSVAVEYRADPTLAYNELANVIVSLGGNL